MTEDGQRRALIGQLAELLDQRRWQLTAERREAARETAHRARRRAAGTVPNVLRSFRSTGTPSWMRLVTGEARLFEVPALASTPSVLGLMENSGVQQLIGDVSGRRVSALSTSLSRAVMPKLHLAEVAADFTGSSRVAAALDLPGFRKASLALLAPSGELATAAIDASRLNPALAAAARSALRRTARMATSGRVDKYLAMTRPGAPLFASLMAPNALLANAVKSPLSGPVGFIGAVPPDFTRTSSAPCNGHRRSPPEFSGPGSRRT